MSDASSVLVPGNVAGPVDAPHPSDCTEEVHELKTALQISARDNGQTGYLYHLGLCEEVLA